MRYEPETALCSGADGLDAIRQIIADSRKILKSGGWILIEHGFNQQQAVQTLLKEFGYGEVRGYHDLADHPRIVAGKYNT